LIPYRLIRIAFCCAALVVEAGRHPVAAQVTFGPGPISLPQSAVELVLLDVLVVLKGSTGDSAKDAILVNAARTVAAFGPGDRYNQILADGAALRMRRLAGVRNATYTLQQRINPDGVTLVFTIEAQPGAVPPEARGVLNGGPASEIPLLYQSERSLLTLTLNGGSGLFRDGQAWFGAPGVFTRNNPLVANPARGAGTGAVSAWTENYVEYGLGGIAQLGDSPVYAYGAASLMAIMAAGQDIFRSDTRSSNTIEKLYAGLLYAGPTGTNATLSVGRQNFSLNDGFLVSQFGSQWNAGPRPGVYLSPRTTHDFSILGQINWQGWTLKGFLLNPNEYEPIESNTQVAGANLRYTWNPSFYADASFITVVQSNSTYGLASGQRESRAGLMTLAGHIRWANRAIVDGLWVESEIAHQSHRDFPMDAWAGYGTIGYLARDLPWTPSISYRLAYFSGDNPSSRNYERFDTLYSGGLGEWLQGISFAKVLSQSNKISDRVRINLVPMQNLNLTFDWLRHRADTLTNIGANPAISQLSSHDLGQEFQFVGRWSINRHFYVQGVAGYAIPGQALKEAAAVPLKPWTTLQAQLFWTL
jgi:hypothetical protein